MPITRGHYWKNVFSRHDDIISVKKNNHDELIFQIEKITKTHFKSVDWRIIERHQCDGENRIQCICSHLGLHDVYIVEHIPTGMRFSIGSTCIHHFGNENLSADVRSLKRNNRCEGGFIIKNLCRRPGCWGICDEPSCTTCMSRRCKADNCNKYIGDNCSSADFCSDTCEKYTRYMERLRSPFVAVTILPNKVQQEDSDFKRFKMNGVLRWNHDEQEWQCKEYVKEQVLRWWNGVKTPKPLPVVPRAPPPRPLPVVPVCCTYEQGKGQKLQQIQRAPPPRPLSVVLRAPPPRQVVQKKLITELSTEERLKMEQEIEKERERERNAEANYQERFDGLTKRNLES